MYGSSIVMAAILNGAFREVILVPATGTGMALLLGGVLLTLLVFLASLASIKIIRPSSEKACLYVGLLWVS